MIFELKIPPQPIGSGMMCKPSVKINIKRGAKTKIGIELNTIQVATIV